MESRSSVFYASSDQRLFLFDEELEGQEVGGGGEEKRDRFYETNRGEEGGDKKVNLQQLRGNLNQLLYGF